MSSATERQGIKHVMCHFSEIKEKTPKSDGLQMKCYFKDTMIKVLTPGGQEFIVPFNQEVINIFAIHDGIIIQAKHSLDSVHYVLAGNNNSATGLQSPFAMAAASSNSLEPSPTYSYFAVTGHPLNDVSPLGYGQNPDLFKDLYDSHKRLLYVSPILPIVVMHDSSTNQLEFCLLKKSASNEEKNLDEDAYLSSIMPSSRHKSLMLPSSQHLLYLDPIWRITSTSIPDNVFASPCLVSEHQIVFQVQYKGDKQVAFIAADVRNLAGTAMIKSSFKVVDVVQEAQNVRQILLTPNGKKLDLFNAQNVNDQAQVRDLVQALENLPTHQLLVQKSFGTSHLYHGLHEIVSLMPSEGAPAQVLHELQDDWLLRSIVEIFKITLPKDTFVSIYSDIVTALLESKNEKHNQPFDMILNLLSGKMQRSIRVRDSQSSSMSPTKTTQSKLAQFKTQMSGNFNSVKSQQRKNDQGQSQVLTPTNNNQTSSIDPFAEMLMSDDNQIGSKLNYQRNIRSSNELCEMFGSQFVENLQETIISQDKNNLQKKAEMTSINFELKTKQEDLIKHADDVFMMFHYLYEDVKLNKLRFASVGERLCTFLIKWLLAITRNESGGAYLFGKQDGNQSLLKKMGFINYYITDFPNLEVKFSGQLPDAEAIIASGVLLEEVPQIFKRLAQCITTENPHNAQQQEKSHQLQQFLPIFKSSAQLIEIYSILGGFSEEQNQAQESPLLKQDNDVQVATERLNEIHILHCQSQVDNNSPYEGGHAFEKVLVAMLRHKITHSWLAEMPAILSLPIYEVLRYSRLFLEQIKTPQMVWPREIYQLIGREDVGGKQFQDDHRQDPLQLGEEHSSSMTSRAHSFSGFRAQFLVEKFSKDSRFKEVCHFLSSSKEMTLSLKKIANYDTLTEEQQKDAKLKLLDKLFIRHLSKMAGRGLLLVGTKDTIPTEMLDIPAINTVSHIPSLETSISVDIKDDISKELLQWPQFHNGAASALQIALSLQLQRQNDSNFVRNWIMQHKPAVPRADHGGFLLTLGLFGMLDSLQVTDIYQNLKSMHDLTIIGILLGRATSKIGTMDQQDTRSLCMHISCLVPPSLPIDISLPVQSAAIIGTGLLYKGTMYRQITEMLLAQIGRRPMNDKSIEREVYALSSGLALGLVNLGAGQELIVQFGDLNIEERLVRFIEGGKIMDLPKSSQQSQSYSDGQQCSSVKEGDQVNVHITSSGALYALCFINLQSNNSQVTAKLSLPDSFHSLEYVRPAFLLQKVLCRNLIMWDQITASKEWVHAQLPEIIQFIFENDITTVEKKFSRQIGSESIDYACISLCYMNILTGAYLSIGYKYAGSGNLEAFNMINSFVTKMKKAKVATQYTSDLLHQIYSDRTKNLIDKFTQENCLCICALAMSLVMAGTGNVECFRTLRVIRKKLESEMHYGHNMAINMALGFLFLGSGAFCLSKSKFGIASLMCSLYPVFPRDPNDNRFHLQALRHFWVMAIETRMVQARDIDSGEYVQVSVTMKFPAGINEQSTQSQQTPVLIDEEATSLEIHHEGYYPTTIKVSNGKIIQQKGQRKNNLEQVILIKKKNIQEVIEDQQRKDKVSDKQDQDQENVVPKNNYTYIIDKKKQQLVKSIKDVVGDIDSKYAKSRDVLQLLPSNDPEKHLFNHFAHINEESLTTQYSLSQLVLQGRPEGINSFDMQDTIVYAQYLFDKLQNEHILAPTLKSKVDLTVLIEQCKTQDRMKELPSFMNGGDAQQHSVKAAVVKLLQKYPELNSQLHQRLPCKISFDPETLVNQVAALGMISAKSINSWSPSPLSIQVLSLLFQNFFNQLSQQGEQQLVNQFTHQVANDGDLSSQPAFVEIHKALGSMVSTILKNQEQINLEWFKEDQGLMVKCVVKGVIKLIITSEQLKLQQSQHKK